MEINLTSLVQKDGFYEYDFFPGRQFAGVSNVLLYRKESFGNLEYLWHFHQCEKQNIQVIVYTTKNLFPLASMCSHKCRMMDANVNLSFYDEASGVCTYYNFKHKKAGAQFNVPCWDISNPLKDVKTCYKSWEIVKAAEYCTQRPLYMDIDAFEKYKSAKEMYKDGTICVERKKGCTRANQLAYSNLGRRLSDFGKHVVGYDHVFQQEVIKKYGGEDCYLSFQILASLFNRCAFVGVAGAGSLFTLALPINAIFVTDKEMNLPEMHRLCKSRFNKSLFNVPTHGCPADGEYYGFGNLLSGWRWAMIEEAFNSINSITLPKVQINYLI